MPRDGANPDDGAKRRAIQDAIERVLEAEREAEACVERCADEAGRSLEQATRAARGILQHAERRAAALHERYGQAREQRLARLYANATGHDRAPDAGLEEERIRRAVARLTAHLLGDTP